MPQLRPAHSLSARRLQAPGRGYDFTRTCWRFAFGAAMRVKTYGLEHADLQGGALLAVSHVSHLDPVVVSVMLPRRISWMAREEFYINRFWSGFLDRMGAFPVNRQGQALPAIRSALSRLRRGEMVGIFPEGEIMRGPEAVVHGGRIRCGVALLAARTGVPVVPVVVSGTQRVNRVIPWLPLKMGRLWMVAGPALHAPPDGHTRAGRERFATRLERAFVELYGGLRREFPQPETVIP